MNAVIDEDLPRSLAQTLSSLNFIVFDIRDHGLRGKSDDVIFSFAQRHKAILFTADLGFSNLLSFPPGMHAGIVILRFPNELSVTELLKQTKTLLSRLDKKDFVDNLIIVSPGKIRIRRKQLN